jgi:phospholipid transport system substrate-binding protein
MAMIQDTPKRGNRPPALGSKGHARRGHFAVERVMKTQALALLAGSLAIFGVQAASVAPDQAIRQATDQLQANIQQHRAEYTGDSAKFYKMVDELVVPHFDTQAIGRAVLGRHWREASEDQRQRFVNAFKNSLVHSYADALLKYADTVKMNWKPARPPQGKEARVEAEILRQQGPPIPLAFKVDEVNNDWKIYDVEIDGVSLGMTFRSQYSAEIKKNGLDPLIARLESGGKPLKDENAVKQKTKVE